MSDETQSNDQRIDEAYRRLELRLGRRSGYVLDRETQTELRTYVANGYHSAVQDGRIEEFDAALDKLTAGLEFLLPRRRSDDGPLFKMDTRGYTVPSRPSPNVSMQDFSKALKKICPCWPFC